MAQKNRTPLDKQVRDAAKELADQGKPVTNQTVREAIGGGSFRDIGPLLKALKAEIAAQELAARKAPDMPEDFRDAAAAMWTAAWELADELAASERRAHAAEIEKLNAEVEEALSNCALVEDERDETEARRKETAEMVQTLTDEVHKAELEIARLTGRLTERDDAEARAEEAEGRIQTLSVSLHKAELEIAELRGRLTEREDESMHRAQKPKGRLASSGVTSDEHSEPDMFNGFGLSAGPEEQATSEIPEVPISDQSQDEARAS